MCALLWRFMFGVANTFVELSEGMAKYGFLAFSSAIVAFTVSSALSFIYLQSIHLLFIYEICSASGLSEFGVGTYDAFTLQCKHTFYFRLG